MGVDPLALSHSTTNLLVHMVWATRCRAPELDPRVDTQLAGLLQRKARQIHCRLLAVGNASDHIHVLVRHPPNVAVAQIAHRLKGASSRALNHRQGTTGNSFWQAGYWAESIDPHDFDGLVLYIRRQRAHHDEKRGRESWESAFG